jgi:hypothetical protein
MKLDLKFLINNNILILWSRIVIKNEKVENEIIEIIINLLSH